MPRMSSTSSIAGTGFIRTNILDDDLNQYNYITSGKVYRIILDKERRGEYLGRDVQVVPHVTGEIKYLIRTKAHEGPYDII